MTSALAGKQNDNGHTALHLAVNNGNSFCVDILVQCGSDLHIRDKDGNTPKQLARQLNKQECVEKLACSCNICV